MSVEAKAVAAEAISVEAAPERAAEPGRADPSLARAGLLPVAFAVVFGVRYGMGTSLTIAMAAAAPLILLFVVSPLLAARSQRSFDQVVAAALATGKPSLLERAWKRAWLFRIFGSPGEVHERRGLIASANEDWAEARDAYVAAKKSYERVAPISVMFGWADACFELEEYADAAEGYEQVLRWDPTLHRARRNLGFALVALDRIEDAEPWLEGCPEPGNDAHHYRLLRAAVYATVGKRKEAREWRKKAGKPRDDRAKELAALSR